MDDVIERNNRQNLFQGIFQCRVDLTVQFFFFETVACYVA
jgi:hypothetical protein